MKTGILPNSDDAIMVDANIQDPKFDDSMNVINTFPDVSDVNKYLHSFDQEMNENDNDSSSDEEIPLVSEKNATNGLETFVNFFKQQKNDEKFKPDDLHIFRKYLGIVRLMEPKIQSSIHEYFKKNN